MDNAEKENSGFSAAMMQFPILGGEGVVYQQVLGY